MQHPQLVREQWRDLFPVVRRRQLLRANEGRREREAPWFFHSRGALMRMRVSIDPGHGGSNKGADMGPMIEKRYTFSLSGLLMETMPDGIDAFRTRDRDDLITSI